MVPLGVRVDCDRDSLDAVVAIAQLGFVVFGRKYTLPLTLPPAVFKTNIDVNRFFQAFPVGQLTDPQHAGAFFALDLVYFLWIAGFAQFVGVLCPTAEAAALLNSVPLGLMASFAGVLLPYPQIPSWWR